MPPLSGRALEVTYKDAAALEADIKAAPNPFAAFPDLLLKVSNISPALAP